MKAELRKKINSEGLHVFCAQNNVSVLYIFGSQLTGDNDKFSDLDLGIVFKKSEKEKICSADFYMNFKNRINQFFKFSNIDLIFMQKAGIKINFKIVSTGEVLYSATEEERLNYEDMIICRGLDFKGEMNLYYRELQETL